MLGVDGQFPSLWSFLAAPPAPPGHQVRVRPAPGRAVTYAARGQDLLQQPVEVLLLGAEVALVLRPEAQLPVLDHLGVEVSVCRNRHRHVSHRPCGLGRGQLCTDQGTVLGEGSLRAGGGGRAVGRHRKHTRRDSTR